LQHSELFVTGEIGAIAASNDGAEDAEMAGYTLGEVNVGPGGENQLTTPCAFLWKEVKELPVIGQVGDVEFHARGDEGFELRFATQ